MRRLFRILRQLLLVLALCALVGLGLLLWGFHRSQALLEGELSLEGLGAAVTVERDALGVPTLHGADRLDLARATGFLHAQERFFQMDALRRAAAGELAELAGELALEPDRFLRRHRLRARAEALYPTLPEGQRALLEAYAAGVNAGLEALEARPPEHLLLAARPRPWTPVDSLLAAYAMYFNLQDSTGGSDYARTVLRGAFTPEVYAFLMENGSAWDAPMRGEARPLLPLPVAESWPRYADLPGPPQEQAQFPSPAPHLGSNAWAVAGSRTADGRALLACDLHLGLGVPNTWYRLHLQLPGEPLRSGLSLPGAPLLIIGTNGHLAWGFTNSYADLTDLIRLETHPEDAHLYRTPDGWEAFTVHEEILQVRLGEAETLSVRETRWGPVVELGGQSFALRWMAHQPYALNLGLFDLEAATSVEEALAIAQRTNLPTQNFLVADAQGRIAWTYIGPLPQRAHPAAAADVVLDPADPAIAWEGRLDPAQYPQILDPANGLLWTANNRVLGGDIAEQVIGNGGQDEDPRAWRIHEVLEAAEAPDERAMLALQLDIQAPYFARWQELFLRALERNPTPSERQTTLRDTLARWTGTAAVDDPAHALLTTAQGLFGERLLRRLIVPVVPELEFAQLDRLRGWETPFYLLAREQPDYLADPSLSSWDAELLAALEEAAGLLERNLGRIDPPWAEFQRVRVAHPLPLGPWLAMPEAPLPGDITTVRAQGRGFGASNRLVVSPGREADGILHLPAGPSGHFLSPYFGTGHEDWVQGAVSPLLPGEAAHTLTLRPAP